MKDVLIYAITCFFVVIWCGDVAKLGRTTNVRYYWLHFLDLVIDSAFIFGWTWLASMIH